MSTEAQPAKLYDEPLRAAALDAGRWRWRRIAAHLGHMPTIGIDPAPDPQTVRKSDPAPPPQHSAKVEL